MNLDLLYHLKIYQATRQLQARLRALSAVNVAGALMTPPIAVLLTSETSAHRAVEEVVEASALSALQNSVARHGNDIKKYFIKKAGWRF